MIHDTLVGIVSKAFSRLHLEDISPDEGDGEELREPESLECKRADGQARAFDEKAGIITFSTSSSRH